MTTPTVDNHTALTEVPVIDTGTPVNPHHTGHRPRTPGETQ
ncbi:hypothetical protein [Actinokineospora inagensis]|nr:hypothetical protein [Actinokineospora inagensis]